MIPALTSITQSLERSEIIPDVLNRDSFTPSILFSVAYPNGKEALLGNELVREDTLEEPSIIFTPVNLPSQEADASSEVADVGKGVSYTLVMTDPDAPSRADPKYRQFRHWVITGIKAPPVTSSEFGNQVALKTRDSTTPYRPPGPGPRSGLHRYTFLLFEEPSTGVEIPAGAPEYGAQLEERRSWDAAKFGETYGLKLVGANFFLMHALDA